MDIDEFLDKELKKGIEEKPKIIETTKEEKDIIKQYFDLWNKVSETKFNWDNEIYAELDKVAKKVKEEMNKLSSKIIGQKNAIKRLIARVTEELEKKDYEAATKLFAEISDMRNSFPDFFLEEKKTANKEIFQLYQKLHDAIDSKFINDFNVSIAKVDKLIRESFTSIKMDKTDAAKNQYKEALETYKSLPNGFLAQKLELGNGLLALYKELSIHTEIKDLEKQLDEKSLKNYKFVSRGGDLAVLSEIIKNKVKEPKSAFSNLKAISAEEKHRIYDKNLLNRLVERKLERARINLKKGLYLEAKKNINSVLKVDPGNTEAKQLLDTMPVEY